MDRSDSVTSATSRMSSGVESEESEMETGIGRSPKDKVAGSPKGARATVVTVPPVVSGARPLVKKPVLGSGVALEAEEVDEVAKMRAITNALQRKLAECGLTAAQMVEVLEITGGYSDVLTRVMLRGTLPISVSEPVRPSPVKKGDAPRQPVSTQLAQRRSRSKKKMTYAVIVKGGEGVAPASVQQQLLKDVGGKVDVRVKNIRPVSTGVRVVTCSSAEVEKLRASEAIKAAGLSVEDPLVTAPRVIVMDVPQEIAMEELMRQIYDKNVGTETMTYEAYERAVRLVNRPNSAGATGDVVLAVPERLAEAWKRQGRLYVRWQSYRVRVMENLLGCYKCFAMGHWVHECKVARPVCRKCGEEGHMKAVCPNEESCRNCRLLGRPSNHSVTSVANCPVYARACGRKVPSV